MADTDTEALTLQLGAARGDGAVSGLLQVPGSAWGCVVLAHGAGAGMDQPFMAALAAGLARHGVATLRYQFPFMQRGSRRVDPPAVAHAAVRAATQAAARRLPGCVLVAGGKSFGGRMTSQAQAAEPLPGVAGLVFVGFPLHPAGKPSAERAAHLADVRVPLLFLQGTRDALAALQLLRPVVGGLGSHAALHIYDDADHAFHVRKSSGTDDAAVLAGLCADTADWMRRLS